MAVAGKTQDAVDGLRPLIADLGVGSRLPSERDLASRWGLARMTVRRAIEVLVDEGRLERRPGSGTYVVNQPHAKMLGLSSFTDDMRRRGRVPSSRILEFSHQDADDATAARLETEVGDRLVRATRLRLADGEPVAVETNWLPARRVPGLAATDLEGSLFAVLQERFDILPGQAHSVIDPVLPDAAAAAALEIDASTPCLRIRMDYLDHRRRPLMAATGIYVGSRYQLEATLTAAAFASELSEART